jgi:hypothetical protein
MASRRSSGIQFKIDIEGLDQLDRLPGQLQRGQRVFMDRLVDRLADDVSRKAPGGAGGSVGRSMRGQAVSDTHGFIESNHPGAKALDRGAYIVGKNSPKKLLRFQVNGEVVFARFVRLKPRHYVARGLRTRKATAASVFSDTLGDLTRFVS